MGNDAGGNGFMPPEEHEALLRDTLPGLIEKEFLQMHEDEILIITIPKTFDGRELFHYEIVMKN